MNVKEIVSRETGLEISVEEMIFVIESYISDLKNTKVDINIDNNQHPFFYKRQLSLLNSAFNDASAYYLKR